MKSGAAWVSHTQGHQLADVLLPVHITDKDDNEEELSQSEGDETNGYKVLKQLTEKLQHVDS